MVGRPEVPRRLGNYTLGEVLGRGGMGTVYRAKADGSDEAVALKVLLPELAQDLEYLKRFRREIKAGSRLTCPYVVHIVGWGEDQGYFYFAMELLENGKDLARVLEDDDRMKASQVMDVGIQLCQALDELHRTGVVHRDIKPGNIMLLPDNTIKLMDFGLAKMLDRTALTATGEALGSPRYMSPEILKGLPADYRSDVYQVGVLLYELVCGEPAFDGESFDRLLHLILETSAIDINTLYPDVSPDLAAVIRTCMRKSPTDRYRTVAELQANLEAVKDGRPPLPPFSGKVSGKSDVGPRASSHATAAALDHTDAVKTRKILTEGITPPKVMAFLFFLVMALVAVVLMRQPPAAIDPQVQITKGFQSVEIRWQTAQPCATRARTRIGKGPIKEYTNAVETKATEHTILLKNLEVGKPYKVKLAGTRGPYRAPVLVELVKPAPPSAVRVNRRGNTIAVEAAFPLRVRASLNAYTLGQAYRSEPLTSSELSMLIRCSITGVPAYADVSRLELLLTDRFGTTKVYPLEAQPGTVALLLMSRDAASRPLDAAVKEFAPNAAKFFVDKNVPIEQKADVYRALLRAEANEQLFAPFVSWHRATEVLANGAPTARPGMATLPLQLTAVPTSSKLVGEGKLFAIHLEETPVAGRQAFLCFSRSELPPKSKLHILVGDGFEILDSILRPAGEWFVKFPAGLLGQRRLAMVRFVLVGESGTTVRIDSVGLQTP